MILPVSVLGFIVEIIMITFLAVYTFCTHDFDDLTMLTTLIKSLIITQLIILGVGVLTLFIAAVAFIGSALTTVDYCEVVVAVCISFSVFSLISARKKEGVNL